MTPDEIIRPHLEAMLAEAQSTGDVPTALNRYIRPIVNMVEQVVGQRDAAAMRAEEAEGAGLARALEPLEQAWKRSPGDCLEWNAARSHFLATSMRDLTTFESPTLVPALEWLHAQDGRPIVRPEDDEETE